MILERGGRSDKLGNIYELHCAIYLLLDVISGKEYSITVEPLGDDEIGTDIIVTDFEGNKCLVQCKASNGGKNDWSISDLKSRGILKSWTIHLNRNRTNTVEILSPCSAEMLETLISRVRNTSSDPLSFYKYQVSNNEKLKSDYKKFCEGFSITIDNIDDANKNNDDNVRFEKSAISKSIDYLRRIKINRKSLNDLNEWIELKTEHLFSSEKDKVLNLLKSIFDSGENFGREITIVFLKELFDKSGVFLRAIEDDTRVYQRLFEINNEYEIWSRLIDDTLIERPEFEKCISLIENDQSFIISGQAGMGKSGCTEAIIRYCVNEKIPYIALKLDRKTPQGSLGKWSNDIGFPYSFVEVVNRLSVSTRAIIILDQLDALRWTLPNSRQALDVCVEIINAVKLLNKTRQKKICIVFVCRKYDLENDSNIKALFEKKVSEEECKVWEKVEIGRLSEENVKELTGEYYSTMSEKMKSLIAIPSNMFIWKKIQNKDAISDCNTTGKLIEEWYNQICINQPASMNLQHLIDEIVQRLESNSCLYLPKAAFRKDASSYSYLVSSGLLIDEENKLGFVHQSVLDYFISAKMVEKFYDDVTIEQIIGSYNSQTPIRRYQVQMFLQQILEADTHSFIRLAEEILRSANIRFYFKHLVYECAGMVENPNEEFINYIQRKSEEQIEGDYWINNVIIGRVQFVKPLFENGTLGKWYSKETKKATIYRILQSVNKDLSSFGYDFISKIIFADENDDMSIAQVLSNDFVSDSDEMFELRLELYKRYPSLLKNIFFSLNKALGFSEKRVVQLIVLWLENREVFEEKNNISLTNVIYEDGEFNITDGRYILDNLLKYVPRESDYRLLFSDWTERHYSYKSSERIIMDLLKKATQRVAEQDSELFWKYYNPYLCKGLYLFDELILSGFIYLTEKDSDKVILYICQDFDKNIYDKTSGTHDRLGYVKEAIKKHSINCSKEVFEKFENRLINYCPNDMVDRFKRRKEEYEYWKEYNEPVYLSFWGELQYELLQVLPKKRLSDQSTRLFDVLKRKFVHFGSIYLNDDGHAGSVNSPVTGKKLGKKQWLQIITNTKIVDKRHGKWKRTQNGFIESSIEMYAADFIKAVSDAPEDYLKLALDNKNAVLPEYVESLFNGIAYSQKISDISHQSLELMFTEFKIEKNEQCAYDFCNILEKRSDEVWSSDIISQLKKLALEGIVAERQFLHKEDSSSNHIFENCLNSIRGHALRALEKLLWSNYSLLEVFKEDLDLLSKDNNPIIRMSVLFPLWPSYNIDREWAQERIISIYEADIRLVRFPDTREMFFRLYPIYGDRVLSVVEQCFNSEDDNLVKIGSYCVCEFYITENLFENIINGISDDKKIKYILDMAVPYLRTKFKEKAKELIIKYRDSDNDTEFVIAKILGDDYVDLKNDRDFLISLIEFKWSWKSIHYFVKFLENSGYSLKEYADIIIKICDEVINSNNIEPSIFWYHSSEISKLVISLYDEYAKGDNPEDVEYVNRCLDIWDIMFKKQIGYIRELSKQIMER